jgi:hypothetical protein
MRTAGGVICRRTPFTARSLAKEYDLFIGYRLDKTLRLTRYFSGILKESIQPFLEILSS